MKNSIVRKSIGVALSIASYFVAVQSVMAAGGYGPYSPHVPEDTFGSTSILTIAAVASYAAGVGLITYSKILRNRFLAQKEA